MHFKTLTMTLCLFAFVHCKDDKEKHSSSKGGAVGLGGQQASYAGVAAAIAAGMAMII